MRVGYWTQGRRGGGGWRKEAREGVSIVHYSGETGWGVEEEDTQGKEAYADNAPCLKNSDFIGGTYPPQFYGFP